jgi:RNA polymerase sigma-54 factor
MANPKHKGGRNSTGLKNSTGVSTKPNPQTIVQAEMVNKTTTAFSMHVESTSQENEALEVLGEEIDDQNDQIFGESRVTVSVTVEGSTNEPILVTSNNASTPMQPEFQATDNVQLDSFLESQLKVLNLSEEDFKIGMMVIERLEDSGLLLMPASEIVEDAYFHHQLPLEIANVDRIIRTVQTLEPIGIASFSYEESYIAQLQEMLADKMAPLSKRETLLAHLGIAMLKDHLELVKNKKRDSLARKLNVSLDTISDALDLLSELRSYPAYGYINKSNTSEKVTEYITPDFRVYTEDGQIKIQVHRDNYPRVRVREDFQVKLNKLTSEVSSLKGSEKAVKKEIQSYYRSKVDEAQAFMNNIEQRYQTMRLVMTTICQMQHKFFFSGDDMDLEPMILNDIASKIDLDISTVSRVASTKYVETEWGILPLKKFFSESITTEDGVEISTSRVKKMIQNLIDNEDKSKPLSDEAIKLILDEGGCRIARRTVAKYREQLKIKPSNQRKN